VWREDSSPLAAMVKEYAGRPDSQDPVARDAETRRRLPAVQRQVVAAVAAWQRPAVRTLLAKAATGIPLRGVSKRAFLQSIDVARGAARRAGELLVAQGTLAEADDIFMLTVDEMATPLPRHVQEMVAWRKEQRAGYRKVTIPDMWTGTPAAVGDQDGGSSPALDPANESATVVVNGIGVSAGVTEGVVRIVTDPSFTDVEPDEVLVAPTTDPSWSSIMFISSALVVDIGGMLSHAAVVARELRIPCVVNTRTGTKALHTGDRVRVDGTTGTVTVLERAERQTT
jgi:pyruvate,water dikinase